jgi:hypothetical protein
MSRKASRTVLARRKSWVPGKLPELSKVAPVVTWGQRALGLPPAAVRAGKLATAGACSSDLRNLSFHTPLKVVRVSCGPRICE